MHLAIDQRVRGDFPRLNILTVVIKDLKIKNEDPHLKSLREEIIREVRCKYNIESLRDLPSIKAYRDFLWKIKVDPTKNRPAAEALIRRILLGNDLPEINTFVDSLNLASIKSEVAIASFDMDKIIGEPILRYAVKGEKFYGIGMKNPIVLQGSEIVIADGDGVIAIYPYRDSERTKITESTRNALLVFCGVPGVARERLLEAKSITVNLIKTFCGGKASAGEEHAAI
jgi:DNA/RNA-binding domain of Phe-tRNA-synthetase-like protein